MTENEAFQAYHKALLLPPRDVAFARGFPEEIRKILTASSEITVSHSFLQGSLARKTMIPPLKDGDMVITLDRDRHGHLMASPTGPEDSMDLLEAVLRAPLRQRFPQLRFLDRTTHALPIELGAGFPDFDLVPGFEEIEPPGELGNVFIANRDTGEFEWSNPRELRHVVASRNQSCDGNLVYVCRMVKSAIRARAELDGFPGLVVEALACDRLTGRFSLARGVLDVLDEGANRIGVSPIYEPTKHNELTERLDKKGLTVKSREWFINATADARRARQAADGGDHDRAIHWWYRALGDPFPKPPKSATSQGIDQVIQGLTYGVAAPKPTRAGGE